MSTIEQLAARLAALSPGQPGFQAALQALEDAKRAVPAGVGATEGAAIAAARPPVEAAPVEPAAPARRPLFTVIPHTGE